MYTVTNWPNRDPIGERGGLNLYAFVHNNGVDKLYLLGHSSSDCCGGQKLGKRENCCGGKPISNRRGCCNGEDYSKTEKCCQGGSLVDMIPRWEKDGYGSAADCASSEAPDLETEDDDGVGDSIQYTAEQVIPGAGLVMDAVRLTSCRKLVCP